MKLDKFGNKKRLPSNEPLKLHEFDSVNQFGKRLAKGLALKIKRIEIKDLVRDVHVHFPP